jgi:hypothetical protein
VTFCDFFCYFLLFFVTSLTFCNILLHKSHLGLSFVIGAKENLGPFPFLRPKVLAPNLCHVDRHEGCEKFGLGPNVKAFGPILTILSNPISRNLDDLSRHPFGPYM